MAFAIHTSDAREMHDGRAAASQRIATRLAPAEVLSRIIPPLVAVYADGDADLLAADADDAASDPLSELDALGYVVVREARS
jgi:hypothetical protein